MMTADESNTASEQLSPRIDTVFLPVSNLEDAVEWYTETLGFPARWRDDESGYAALDVGETPLTLVRSDDHRPSEDELFNFYTSDADATHAKLRERGVDVRAIEEETGVRFFRFRDVCDNTLAFCSYDE